MDSSIMETSGCVEATGRFRSTKQQGRQAHKGWNRFQSTQQGYL